ncbi:hypothetical protein D3C76_1574700 [compost metagenome]
MVNKPQGLSARALTTTSASADRMIIITPSAPSMVITPAKAPSSCLAISPSERPSRRVEMNRIRKSCTAPASITPTRIQIVPGRKPICAARIGPTSGPAPAMAAKWWPNNTHLLVGT